MLGAEPGVLRKQNGEETPISESFQRGKVFVKDVRLDVERGDQLIRTLPSGREEVRYVTEVDVYKGRLAHIECTTSWNPPVQTTGGDLSSDLPQAIADLGEVLALLQDIRAALVELGDAQQVTREDVIARLETLKTDGGIGEDDGATMMLQQLLSGANNVASNAVFAIVLAALSAPV